METNQYQQEGPKTSIFATSLRYGLILGAVIIFVSLISQMIGLNKTPFDTYATWILFVSMIVWAMSQFRRANGGYMRYGQGLTLGILISIFGGVLVSGNEVFQAHVINPSLIDEAVIKTMVTVEEQNPNLTDEQLEFMESFARWVFKPVPLFVSVLVSLVIVGLLISLVLAIFMRRSNPDPFAEV